ncbi:carbohydrate ABC transporter permease [Humibacter ginsengiterrae]
MTALLSRAEAASSAVGAKAVRRRRFPVGRSFVAFILLAVAAFTIFPLIWLVLTSIRPANTVFGGSIWPTSVSLDAYAKAWSSTDFGLHFANSLWITLATVLGVVVFASLAGYAFAKLRFPFKNVIYVMLLATLMMPSTSLIIPLYLQLKSFGLLNSQVGLLVLYVSSSAPFSMFLMRAFFETLPDELVQAARIDGAGEFQIFWRIVLPLARPGLATVIIFQFLQTWNEFIYANTVLQNTEELPLQPVLFGLVGQYQTDWPTLCAGLTMSIVPVVLVYVWMQRQFVAGMTLGAVKN